MSQFRKRPVVIDATQWWKNGDHPLDYSKDHDGIENGEMTVIAADHRRSKGWEGDIVRYFRHPEVDGESLCKHCEVRMHEHGWIDTLEGGHNVCPGDYIITGVAGENYPCKPAIFDATYDVVREPEMNLDPLTKPANECAPFELMTEIVRRAPELPEILHANFNQNRMMGRNEDGDVTLGELVLTTLNLVTKSKGGKKIFVETTGGDTKDAG
jgi:hypothetical protein